MAWTDKMVEDLKKMWKDGMTTGEIGKKLGVSKNSIVGKVHRLGLSGRPSPIKKKSETTEDSAPIRTVEKKQTARPAEKKPLAEKKTTAEPPKEPAQKPTVSAPKEEDESPEKKFQAPSEEQLANEFTFKADLKKSGASKGKTMLVDLDNHTCRWPIGDPKDENFHFCGKKVKIGQTYCEEHAAIAYVKPNKKITFV